METTLSKTKKTSAALHNLLSVVIDYSNQHNLLPDNAIVVVGLSGGPDSVFLLHVLAELKKRGRIQEIIAVHLDHGWRADSANDVAFCKQLAATYGIPFISDHLTTFAPTIVWNGSKEDLGRKARHLLFRKVMHEYHAQVIALAHHRDDQLETFFIRLIRGTSLTGLCGMRAKSNAIIRPLLTINKKDIITYLDAHKIPYLIDPSNASLDYLRNRIRNTVLPTLQGCDERFESNSMKTIERLHQAEDYLVEQTKELFDAMSEHLDGTIAIAYDQLLEQPLFMQYRLLIHWLISMKVPFPTTEQFLKEIIRFLRAKKSKTHHLMEKWRIVKEKGMVYINKD